MVAILTAIGIVLSGFGILYAWFIKYHPITPTWVSVAIGTGAICLSEMGALFAGLYFDKPGWWMVAIPPIALGLAGIPMAILQQIKWQQTKSHNEEIVGVWQAEFEGHSFTGQFSAPIDKK